MIVAEIGRRWYGSSRSAPSSNREPQNQQSPCASGFALIACTAPMIDAASSGSVALR